MKRCVSKIFAAAALLCPAATLPAQDTIIFSKPADLPASKANAFLPDSSHRAGDYNAPKSVFSEVPRDYPLPRPQPRPDNPALNEELEKRRKWTLLTPEQILGIQTPEQILGVQKTGEPKLSLEEQFLARQNTAAGAATNDRAGGIAPLAEYSRDNPFDTRGRDDAANPLRRGAQPDANDFSKLPGQENAAGDSAVKPRSPWAGDFFQPSAPKPTPEQAADMERFRSLMNPPAPAPDTAPANFTTSRTPPPVKANPFIEAPPAVNPAGREAQPIESLFSRPAGIKPLPPIATPVPEKPKKKADWEANVPPWLRDTPPPVTPSKPF